MKKLIIILFSLIFFVIIITSVQTTAHALYFDYEDYETLQPIVEPRYLPDSDTLIVNLPTPQPIVDYEYSVYNSTLNPILPIYTYSFEQTFGDVGPVIIFDYPVYNSTPNPILPIYTGSPEQTLSGEIPVTEYSLEYPISSLKQQFDDLAFLSALNDVSHHIDPLMTQLNRDIEKGDWHAVIISNGRLSSELENQSVTLKKFTVSENWSGRNLVEAQRNAVLALNAYRSGCSYIHKLANAFINQDFTNVTNNEKMMKIQFNSGSNYWKNVYFILKFTNPFQLLTLSWTSHANNIGDASYTGGSSLSADGGGGSTSTSKSVTNTQIVYPTDLDNVVYTLESNNSLHSLVNAMQEETDETSATDTIRQQPTQVVPPPSSNPIKTPLGIISGMVIWVANVIGGRFIYILSAIAIITVSIIAFWKRNYL